MKVKQPKISVNVYPLNIIRECLINFTPVQVQLSVNALLKSGEPLDAKSKARIKEKMIYGYKSAI